MKRYKSCLIGILVLALSFVLQAQETPDLQLVESVPVETELGIGETVRTLPVWLEMIGSARKSIDMEIFYLSHRPGEALTPVIAALKDAARRGVRIRILADAKMARTYPETLDELSRLPGIEVRRIGHFDQSGGVMHAKYFVVDGEQLFLGSQNMDWRALKHIHELGVRIRNKKLAEVILKIFELDWQIAASSDPESVLKSLTPLPSDLQITASRPLKLSGPDGEPVTLFPTFSPPSAIYPEMARDESEIIKLIDGAEKQVEIQLLSYHSVSGGKFYEKIENALRRAAARGVQVQMIVSNWNTRPPGIEYLKSLQLIPNIEIRISSIPEWSGGFIPFARVEHCKYLAVDDRWVWLGTSNWSYSYFHTSRNLGLVLESREVNRIVRKIFRKSWESDYCRTVDPCREYVPPRVAGEE